MLILGGQRKESAVRAARVAGSRKVRKLVLIGEDAETIANELGSSAPLNARRI